VLTSIGDLLNEAGSGIVLGASAAIQYNPPGTLSNAQFALDFYVDGTFRFNIGVSRTSLDNDNQLLGSCGAFGVIPYTSSIRVEMRRANTGASLHVDAGLYLATGAW
jgi:hypothetical protein